VNAGYGIRIIVAAVDAGRAAEGEMMALLLRDARFEVVWLGGGGALDAIVDAAIQEDADAVALSCHAADGGAIEELARRMKAKEADDVLIVCRGDLGRAEAERLGKHGSVKIFATETGDEEIVACLAAHARRASPRLAQSDDRPLALRESR
jgi:methylmalonyl-CoA mutase C-terminal domain/subunit